MGFLKSAEQAVNRRAQDLRLMRENTQELGQPTPIISLEIAALQVLAGGMNFVKAVTGNNEANI
jgi:hypothetical protein